MTDQILLTLVNPSLESVAFFLYFLWPQDGLLPLSLTFFILYMGRAAGFEPELLYSLASGTATVTPALYELFRPSVAYLYTDFRCISAQIY
jgi:hypothetical protein